MNSSAEEDILDMESAHQNGGGDGVPSNMSDDQVLTYNILFII